jgi:uncharacterized protein YuzE
MQDSPHEHRVARHLTPAPDLALMSGATWEHKMPMHLTYDAKTDMAYLQLRSTGPGDVIGPALILEHDIAFHGVVIADFTLIDGCLVGFEFSFASLCLPAELLAKVERIDGQHLGRRFGERIGRLLKEGMPREKESKNREN